MKKIYLTLMLLISVASLFGQRFSSGISEVSTISDLSSLSPNNGDRIYVQGYYSGFDGGEGYFVYDASADKSTAKGIFKIDPDELQDWDGTQSNLLAGFYANQGTGVGTGLWKRLDDSLSVKQLGIVEDSNVNQYEELEYITENMGGRVLVFDNTVPIYIFNNDLTVDGEIEMPDGITYYSEIGSKINIDTTSTFALSCFDVGDNVTIDGLHIAMDFENPGINSRRVIDVGGQVNFTLKNCTFTGVGILYVNLVADGFLVENNNFNDAQYAIYSSGFLNGKIVNNNFYNRPEWSRVLSLSEGIKTIAGSRIKNVEISWNNFYYINRDGIDLTGGLLDSRITNNYFLENGVLQGGGGIDIKKNYDANVQTYLSDNSLSVDDRITRRIILSHNNFDKSTIVITSTFQSPFNNESEITQLRLQGGFDIIQNTFNESNRALFIKRTSNVRFAYNNINNCNDPIYTSPNVGDGVTMPINIYNLDITNNTLRYDKGLTGVSSELIGIKGLNISNNNILYSGNTAATSLFAVSNSTNIKINNNKMNVYDHSNFTNFVTLAGTTQDTECNSNYIESDIDVNVNLVRALNGTHSNLKFYNNDIKRGRAMFENFSGGAILDSIFIGNNTNFLTSKLLNIGFLGEGAASEALIFDNFSRKKSYIPTSTTLTIYLDPDGEVININTSSSGGIINPTINVYNVGYYTFIIDGSEQFTFPTDFDDKNGIDVGTVNSGTFQFYYDGLTYTLLNKFLKFAISSVQTTNFTVELNAYNLFDATGGAITATVPSGVTEVGTEFIVTDEIESASITNSVTIDFSTNGYTVEGQNSAVLNEGGTGYKFVYIGSNKWISESL